MVPVTSEELASEVEAAISRTRGRVLGVGDQQYSQGDTQKFETMEVDELFAWMQEELDDVIVYAVMLGIRLRRTRDTFVTVVFG